MDHEILIYELGGRKFRQIVSPTVELSMEMDKLILESGVARVLHAGATEGEAGGEYGGRIWEAISRSSTAFAFIGKMILPENVPDLDWSPEESARTAAFVKKLHGPEDAATVQQILIRLVISFFAVVRHSSRLSDIALGSHGPAAAPARTVKPF